MRFTSFFNRAKLPTGLEPAIEFATALPFLDFEVEQPQKFKNCNL
jgi:hypothetical protein